MQIVRRSLVLLAISALLLLAGCFPGPERVGELTLSTMQARFRNDPQLKTSGAEVVAVKVNGGSRSRYAAVASIRHAGKTYEVPITIVLDGFNLEWFSEPAALDFLAPKPPANPPAGPEQIPR